MKMTRREFVGRTLAIGIGAGAPTFLRGQNLNNKLNIAFIACGGRANASMASVIAITVPSCPVAASAYRLTADAAAFGFSQCDRTTSRLTETPFSAPFISWATRAEIRCSVSSHKTSIAAPVVPTERGARLPPAARRAARSLTGLGIVRCRRNAESESHKRCGDPCQRAAKPKHRIPPRDRPSQQALFRGIYYAA